MASSTAENKSIQLDRIDTAPATPRKAYISQSSTFATLVESPTELENGLKASPGGSGGSNEGEKKPPLQRRTTYRVEDDAQHGYPKLATYIAEKDSCAIFKRFASLNARNLLYHQAKLVTLEHELNDLEYEYRWCKELHYNVGHLFHAEPGSPGYALRMKHEEVDAALEKYNTLLLAQKRLHDLPTPEDVYVNSIHNFIHQIGDPGWLKHPEDVIYQVYDEDRSAVQKDLVTLNPSLKTRDPFTKYFISSCLYAWNKIWKNLKEADDEYGGYNYREETLAKYMTVIVMVFASALPTTSIVALYFIQSAIWRLVFIILYGAIFAACIAFFTGASRVDIFTASVALAGVQVVFVGTAFGGSGGTTN